MGLGGLGATLAAAATQERGGALAAEHTRGVPALAPDAAAAARTLATFGSNLATFGPAAPSTAAAAAAAAAAAVSVIERAMERARTPLTRSRATRAGRSKAGSLEGSDLCARALCRAGARGRPELVCVPHFCR